jgi:antitoxin (DNA-binding transcriptional repressor) of toxin-antitoxin stability system
MKQYTTQQLQENLDEVLQEVQAGVPVELLRDGRAIAIIIKPDMFTPSQDLDQDSERPDLWEAIQQFRQECGLDSHDDNEDDDPDPFANLRDPSPGRDVEF